MTVFAVDAALFFLLGFLQWTVHVLLIERVLIDPFHNFIDLCSIANIRQALCPSRLFFSVLCLTHPLHGFYIHGRSVHGRADTNMAEMNDFLQRERVLLSSCTVSRTISAASEAWSRGRSCRHSSSRCPPPSAPASIRSTQRPEE